MIANDKNQSETVQPPSELMTVEDVARLLGKEIQTIRNMVSRREIPFVPLGRKTAFLRDSVWQWIRAKEVKPHGSN